MWARGDPKGVVDSETEVGDDTALVGRRCSGGRRLRSRRKERHDQSEEHGESGQQPGVAHLVPLSRAFPLKLDGSQLASPFRLSAMTNDLEERPTQSGPRFGRSRPRRSCPPWAADRAPADGDGPPFREVPLYFGGRSASMWHGFRWGKTGVGGCATSRCWRLPRCSRASAAVFPLFPSSASASPPHPPSVASARGKDRSGLPSLSQAPTWPMPTNVRFGRTQASVVVDTSTEIQVRVPSGAITSLIRVTTPEGIATSRSEFVVTGPPLAGVVSLARDGNSSCALLDLRRGRLLGIRP